MSQTSRVTSPRYMRKTAVGDGAFEVSTVDVGPLVSMPETIIFDETRGGIARFKVQHPGAVAPGDLDAVHEWIVAAFAAGEITLCDHMV